ncbi:MAG: alpha/beta fold hydrolase [Sporichthyaceae bacterium]
MRTPETRVVDVGRALQVSHWPGAPGQVPLLLCSGIGASSALFNPLVAALDPRRPLITFNPPGLGASPEARAPYSMATLARSVRRAVVHLGYEQADVLGISWGGVLAQQYAFQNPRRCRRVVLVATHTGWLCVPPSMRTIGRMMTPARHRDKAYARSIAGDLYGGSARFDPVSAVSTLHDERDVPTTRSYLYQLGAISGWTSLHALPLIRQPALVLAGDDDPIIRASNPRMMASLLPNGRLHLYDGGHLELLSRAPEFAPVIDAFLDE